MNTPAQNHPSGSVIVLLLSFAFAAASLSAQTRLYVLQSSDQYRPVQKVQGGQPYVREQDRLVAVAGDHYALVKVDEYLPVLVAVHDEQSRTAPLNAADDQILNSFHYSAEFESPDALTDVFVVLEFDVPNVGKSLFVYEVGLLEARKPKPFSVDLTLSHSLGLSGAKLHLYAAGGAELFHSLQPTAEREAALDRLIAKRIAGVKQAGPQPFFGTAPEYPAALQGTGVRGEAVVALKIGTTGAVLDPTIVRASAPAFGETALAAVRQWRFLPRVVDGRAVETKVNLPVTFEPPKPEATGK
jgi:TonB family protein